MTPPPPSNTPEGEEELEEGGMKVGLTSVNANNIAITVEERRLGVCVERADGRKLRRGSSLSLDTSFDLIRSWDTPNQRTDQPA
jgi:hypothetical protein